MKKVLKKPIKVLDKKVCLYVGEGKGCPCNLICS